MSNRCKGHVGVSSNNAHTLYPATLDIRLSDARQSIIRFRRLRRGVLLRGLCLQQGHVSCKRSTT